jgi:hypothetical protein
VTRPELRLIGEGLAAALDALVGARHV